MMISRNWTAMVILLLLAFTVLPAAANTGRVMTMNGDVMVNGYQMQKSHVVRTGDRITTGTGSHVNIVMSDRSVIDIRPNTKFQLEKFSFSRNQPGRGNSLMNLLRGSFRYISGLVGRANHRNARIRMGTATAGIRGSFATFGFDGETVIVEVSLGNLSIDFEDGSKLKVDGGKTGICKVAGCNVDNTEEQNPIMLAATAILNDSSPEAVNLALQGMSEADKAMVVAVLVANPTQLGASTTEIATAVGAIVNTDPKSAPLIAAIVTAVAEDKETSDTINDAIKKVKGVDDDAVDKAASKALADLGSTTPTSSGRGGVASPSAPIP